MLFSARLRELRIRANMNQKEFAALLGIHPVTLSHYENEKREPDLNRLIELCLKLNVSSDYLLGLSDTLQPAAEKNVAGQKKEPEANAIASSSILGSLPARDLLSNLDGDLRAQGLSYIQYLNEQQRLRDTTEKRAKA